MATSRATSNHKQHYVGDIRPSQLVGPFGVGALLDLPHLSAIVLGLDEWPTGAGASQAITEERLLAAVQQRLGPQVTQMLSSPVVEDPNIYEPNWWVGVPVGVFPRWMHCPRCGLLSRVDDGLFKLVPNEYHPERSQYVHEGCTGRTGTLQSRKPPTVVPARFLVSCVRGHLDDFPWREFAHGGATECRGTLSLEEFDPTGDARSLYVRCKECKKGRALSQAFGRAGKQSMPLCRGRHPHLNSFVDENCGEQVQAILLGASNLWFPDTLTALALPAVSDRRLDQLVQESWDQIGKAENVQNIALLRQVLGLRSLVGFTDEEIFESATRLRNRRSESTNASQTDLKTPEWELFSDPSRLSPGEVLRLEDLGGPSGFEKLIKRVVLVDKLREVRALIGFTRVEPPEGELPNTQDDNSRRAPLSRRTSTWVPSSETRGEGIFIQLQEDALATWSSTAMVKKRDREFRNAHEKWNDVRHINPPHPYPGIRYVLLHSLAHALMRQFVLECGYTASSLQERIYSRDPSADIDRSDAMAGILIYTAAADSEGTLGGLISLGSPSQFPIHLRAALRAMRHCASDPICAEHSPEETGRTLHAASCHACLFAPETACESGNKYLDRAALVHTVESADLAYFNFEY